MKLSEEFIKISNPGIQQVKRYSQQGRFVYDVVYNEAGQQGSRAVNLKTTQTEVPQGESVDLLKPIFESGCQVYEMPDIEFSRRHCQQQFQLMGNELKRNSPSEVYKVGLDEELHKLKENLIHLAKN